MKNMKDLFMWEPISLDEFFTFLQEKEYLASEMFKKSKENESPTTVTTVTKKEIKRNEKKMKKFTKDFDAFEIERIDFSFCDEDGKTKNERVIVSRSLLDYDDNPQRLVNKKKLNRADFRDACLAYQEARRDKAIS